jgi:hypothetical protein
MIGPYEVNLFGVVRRAEDPDGPRGSLSKGDILRPFQPRASNFFYSLVLENEKKNWSAHSLVQRVHGCEMWQHENIFTEILALVEAQRKNKANIKREIRKTSKTRSRLCHDCGRPTDNYRCEKCWAKFRSSTDVYNESDFNCRLAL